MSSKVEDVSESQPRMFSIRLAFTFDVENIYDGGSLDYCSESWINLSPSSISVLHSSSPPLRVLFLSFSFVGVFSASPPGKQASMTCVFCTASQGWKGRGRKTTNLLHKCIKHCRAPFPPLTSIGLCAEIVRATLPLHFPLWQLEVHFIATAPLWLKKLQIFPPIRRYNIMISHIFNTRLLNITK